MPETMKVAIIGLDTSHSVEFARSMNAPDCPEAQKLEGMRAVSCLRFSTPFQSEEGLDARQKLLESWGVPVTLDFNEAIADCDAIMLEINDPSYHLEYFKRCVDLGKPIFLDKPVADTVENAQIIMDLVKEKGVRVLSASSLRFASELVDACNAIPEVGQGWTYGPLGKAPAGSSIIWYGVHSFEMLQRAMGSGAQSVRTVEGPAGAVCIIDYAGNRRGVVELVNDVWLYGGCLRGNAKAASYLVDSSKIYIGLLREVERFFRGEESSCRLEDAFEVMAMIDAAQRSADSGKTAPVKQLKA